VHLRRLGKTGREVSEIGFGAWAIGGSWGQTDDAESFAAMEAAVAAGVTFFDTADVYGDGRSERLVARLLRERDEPLVVATKFGRRAPLDPAQYTYDNLRAWLERSRENLGVDVVDLVQLHCPPWETYYEPAVFEACDRLVEEGLVRAYGVSVEKVEEALKAIEYPGIATVQIIFNVFRQRPAELFFEQARRRDVGVIVRIPHASGLLTGSSGARRSSPTTTTAASTGTASSSMWARRSAGSTSSRDSRSWTSSAHSSRRGATLAQLALRWILGLEGVSTVIPGAKTPEQALRTPRRPSSRRCRSRPSDDRRAVSEPDRTGGPSPLVARFRPGLALCIRMLFDTRAT
jgi:aryl-alcohol dehydrogenase-like predicted oxidoreductase